MPQLTQEELDYLYALVGGDMHDGYHFAQIYDMDAAYLSDKLGYMIRELRKGEDG